MFWMLGIPNEDFNDIEQRYEEVLHATNIRVH